MRRIGRWMLNALTVLSLLLCVGTCVLWVRSYRSADLLHYDYYAPAPEFAAEACYSWAITSRVGGLQFARLTYYCAPGTSAQSPHFGVNASAAGAYPPFFGNFDWHHRTLWQRMGFEACDETTNETPPFVTQGVIVPHWFFATLVGLPGVIGARWAFVRLRARRRERAGRCVTCGYDLSGNVSGVCPECGTKIAEAK